METAGKCDDQVQIRGFGTDCGSGWRGFACQGVINGSENVENLPAGDVDDVWCADDLVLEFVGGLLLVEVVDHCLHESPVRYEPLLKSLR